MDACNVKYIQIKDLDLCCLRFFFILIIPHWTLSSDNSLRWLLELISSQLHLFCIPSAARCVKITKLAWQKSETVTAKESWSQEMPAASEWSKPSWTGDGDWGCLTDSARGRLSARLSVSLDNIRLCPQSNQWDRKMGKKAGRVTPAVWQMSIGTNREVWIFRGRSWTLTESQKGCF